MKKIIMLFFALITIFSVKNVFAQDQYKLTLHKQEGIYFSRKGNNFDDDSYPYYLYKFGDIYAYCIQPGKHIITYDYVGVNNFVDLPLSEDVKEKLELIGYFGRDYPGHNNIRYSMATQALIWELTGVDTVTFWTEQDEKGEEIDVSKEKNEIMNLVNRQKMVPNISVNIEGNINRETIINDTNQVLSNYAVENTSDNIVKINGNSLHIIPKTIGNSSFTLKYQKYDDSKTIIFVGKEKSDTQILGRLRLSQEKQVNVNLKVNGIKLVVNKVDENNKKILISGIRFKIKDLSNGTYICENNNCEYTTNSNGFFITKDLDYGEYEIEEIENQLVRGYVWNSNKVKVIIDENTPLKWQNNYNYIDINFVNDMVKWKITLMKKGEKPVFKNNQISYESINLPNVTFELYKENGEYLATAKTDNYGRAIIPNVPAGYLYFIEKTELDNYVINKDKRPFNLVQANQYIINYTTTMSYQNYLKKGILEFTKEDSETGSKISGTVIEIYNMNHELLLTRTTDENGRVIVENFPYGKYYILEKEASNMYQKTDDKLFFEIKENGEVVKVKMLNNKLKGNVEIFKYGEELSIKNNENIYIKNKLSNIEFDLYNDEDILIDTLITDEFGHITKELELGKYYIIEKSRLNNYQNNQEKYYFEIKKDNNKVIDVSLEIENFLKKGKLIIIKEDYYTGEGISNTIIEIYNDQGNLLLTKKTDANGRITVDNLAVGKYYFIEKEANYYYQKTDEKKYFEIKENDELIKVKMTNKPLVGNLEIVKYGEKPKVIDNKIVYENELLANVEFNLYQENNNLIKSIKTDQFGYVKYNNLPIGKYYLIEKGKGNNYILNKDMIPFEIKKDGNMAVDARLEINNYLKKGTLEFSKEDLKTSDGIPNTIIEVYDEKNNLLLTNETDENGKIIIEKLPIGKYYILEKEANSLYQITNEKIFFEIKEDGEIVKAKMTNERIDIPVPKTKTQEGIIVYSLFGLSLLIGLGRFYYERKETI